MRHPTEWLVLAFCLAMFGYSLYAAHAAWGWAGVLVEVVLVVLVGWIVHRFDDAPPRR